MARLPKGEKERQKGTLSRLLNRCRLGLTEQEVAEEGTGWASTHNGHGIPIFESDLRGRSIRFPGKPRSKRYFLHLSPLL